MVCLLRYAQVIEHSHRCWINTSALVSGCTNALGLVMVGNFQVILLTSLLYVKVDSMGVSKMVPYLSLLARATITKWWWVIFYIFLICYLHLVIPCVF